MLKCGIQRKVKNCLRLRYLDSYKQHFLILQVTLLFFTTLTSKDNNMLFVASTHKRMVLIDKRKDLHNHVIFENDSMVNTM